MIVTIWGTRGSIPVSGKKFSKFGGNTTCVEVLSKSGKRFVIDAGSGIRELGNQLLEKLPVEINILFTHYHWDHCIGFPFFVPAFIPGNTINIYGQDKGDESVQNILEDRLMAAPNFPVPLSVMGANIHFHKLQERGKIIVDEGFAIEYAPLCHPNGVVGFRFIENGKVFTFLTDIEHVSETSSEEDPLNLAKDADVLAYDCQYTPEEYQTRVSWGHSTWRAGLNLAQAANVKNMMMIHHDPDHSDEQILKILSDAQDAAKGASVVVSAAYEGMRFEI